MNANSAGIENRNYSNGCLAALVLCSIIVGGFSLIFKPGAEGGSVFDLPYLIGPTAKSFLAGHGFQACSEAMGTEGNLICFQSARMPAATLTIAAAGPAPSWPRGSGSSSAQSQIAACSTNCKRLNLQPR